MLPWRTPERTGKGVDKTLYNSNNLSPARQITLDPSP